MGDDATEMRFRQAANYMQTMADMSNSFHFSIVLHLLALVIKDNSGNRKPTCLVKKHVGLGKVREKGGQVEGEPKASPEAKQTSILEPYWENIAGAKTSLPCLKKTLVTSSNHTSTTIDRGHKICTGTSMRLSQRILKAPLKVKAKQQQK